MRWFFFEMPQEKWEKAIDFSPALLYNKSRKKQNNFMESCPSWSKEHDWKSCKSLKRLRGFESLALRQKMIPMPLGVGIIFSLKSKSKGFEPWEGEERKENSPADCF